MRKSALSLVLAALIGAVGAAHRPAHASWRGAVGSAGGNMDLLYTPPPAWKMYDTSQDHTPYVVPSNREEVSPSNVGHLGPVYVRYSFETEFMRPFIQADLKLGMLYRHQYKFVLDVRDKSGRRAAVPDGYYQLQIAIVRVGQEDIENESGGSAAKAPADDVYDRFVTAEQRVVYVEGGQFTELIELRIPELTATSVVSHFYAQLIPLQDKCVTEDRGEREVPCLVFNQNGEVDLKLSKLKPRPEYKTHLFEMPWMPYNKVGDKDRDMRTLRKMPSPFKESSLAEYVVKARLYKNAQAKPAMKRLTPEGHARQNGLRFADFASDPELMAAARLYGRGHDLQAIVDKLAARRDTGAVAFERDEDVGTLATVLCAYFINRNKSYNEEHANLGITSRPPASHFLSLCMRRPDQAFLFTRVTHVGRPVTDVAQLKRVKQLQLNYGLMANDMTVRAHTRDNSVGMSVNIGMPVLKVAEAFGVKLPADASMSIGISNSRTRSQMGGASLSTNVDFDYYVLRYPTAGSRQCLEIRPAFAGFSPLYDVTAGAQNGLYVCSSKRDADVQVRETYAHTFVRCRDSSIIDCGDPLSQNINLVLRGDREISAFFYSIRDWLTPDLMDPLMQFVNLPDADKFFANTSITSNYEVLTPVSFPSKPIPSFLDQYFLLNAERF